MTQFRLFLLILFLAQTGAAQRTPSASYYAEAPDARIALDLTLLRDNLWNLVRAWYGATYDINATVCNKPPFSVTISDPPRLSASGWFFDYDARFGSTLGITTKFYAHVDSSNPLCQPNATVDCSMTACFGPCSLRNDVLRFPAQCQITGLPGFQWPFVIKLPLPWDLEIPYMLKQPESQPPNQLNFEFGEFRSGTWVSAGTKKVIPYVARVGTVGPNIVQVLHAQREPNVRDQNEKWVPSSDGSPGGAVTNKFLFVDFSFGDRFKKNHFISPTSAEAAHSTVPIWDPSQGLGLAIAPTLFGDPAGASSTVGLFGNLLPIRIFGKQQYTFNHHTGMIGYELFLTKATVKFKPNADTQVAFTVDRITAWLINDSGNAAPAERLPSIDVKVQATIGPPVLGPDGVYAVKVKSFTLYLKTLVGNVPFLLSRKDLAKTINNALATLTQLRPSIALELPDCINTTLKEIAPLQRCQDPTQTVGYMKLMTPEKNKVFTLQLDQAKFRTQNGVLQVGIPMRATMP
jgi:hypothetical protein